MNPIRTLIIIVLLTIQFRSYSNNTSREDGSRYFIETGYFIARIAPNYRNFPDVDPSRSVSLSVGKHNYNPNKIWAVYSNYPLTGVTLSLSHLGNPEVFGNEYKVMPFIEYNTSKRMKRALMVRTSLGCSYVTKPYNQETNRQNKALGSSINWTFKLFLNYNLWTARQGVFRIGCGFKHSSNGHTQLPNVGLNAAAINFSYLNFFGSPNSYNQGNYQKPRLERSRNYFLQARTGLGIHELGGAIRPIGGVKREVYSFALSGGVILKQSLKLQAGLSYRFYEQFYVFFGENYYEGLSDNLTRSASNLYAHLGCELLYSHVGIDMQFGYNIHKPFYSTYNELFTKNEGNKNWMKHHFNTRLGLKLYAFDTNRMPQNNVFIGAHVNANVSQADFSDVSLGYIYVFRR